MGNRGEPENPVVWKAVLQLELGSFFRVFNVYNRFYNSIKDGDHNYKYKGTKQYFALEFMLLACI